jgi:Glycosyl transferase family 2
MNLYAMSARELATQRLPGPSAVLRMADSREQLVEIYESGRDVMYVKNLIFNDASDDYVLVRSPTLEDAKQILHFYKEAGAAQNFVAQCQVGVGRSQAVIAALAKIESKDYKSILRNGTYNRKLYGLILEAAGIERELEPLVSMVVRVKYDPYVSMNTFLNCMLKQRYENWEIIAVTDGLCHWDRFDLWKADGGWSKGKLIETTKPLGLWGHPYRQLGLDAAKGEFIGMSNDDNYYTPGYLEQMVFALQESGADVAMCPVIHSYAGWGVTPPGSDLGCWIARASVVKQHKWPGNEFDSDAKFLAMLREGRKTVVVNKPLFVHN